MNNAVQFVFVLYHPTKEQKRRAWDIVIDNTQKNRGYGGAANVGIRRALSGGAEWVVVCNQDIALTKKDREILIRTLKKMPPGIVGPDAGSLDPKRWTTILPVTGVTDYISGSCIAIHRNVIGKTGYFYEPYFMYYEDADFCVRAKKAGFPLVQIALPGFKHPRASSGRMKDYYLFRNHLLFVLRLAPWRVKLHELLRLPKTIYDYWR